MIKTVLVALGGALAGSATVLFWQTGSVRLSPLDMSYSDLAATLLGAAAVILAGLGLLIAIGALWGWAQFRDLTSKAAAEAARDNINDRLSEQGDLRAHFEQMAGEFLKIQFNSKEFKKLVIERIDYIAYGAAGRGIRGESEEDEIDD